MPKAIESRLAALEGTADMGPPEFEVVFVEVVSARKDAPEPGPIVEWSYNGTSYPILEGESPSEHRERVAQVVTPLAKAAGKSAAVVFGRSAEIQ